MTTNSTMDDCGLTGQPAAARVRLAVDGLQILMVASGPTLLIPAPLAHQRQISRVSLLIQSASWVSQQEA